METFLERFKAAHNKAKCNMPTKDLAIHYLSAIGDTAFTQIILDISDGIRDQWWVNGLDTHHKATSHLDALKNPRINPNDIGNYTRTPNGGNGRNGNGGAGNAGTQGTAGNGNPNGKNNSESNQNSTDNGPPTLGFKA